MKPVGLLTVKPARQISLTAEAKDAPYALRHERGQPGSVRLAVGMNHIVNVNAASEAELIGQRIVMKADHVLFTQRRFINPVQQFSRTNKFLHVVRAARHHAQYVLCAKDRQQPGLGITIDGGKKDFAPPVSPAARRPAPRSADPARAPASPCRSPHHTAQRDCWRDLQRFAARS